MKTVYSADNGIDAQIVCDVLQSAGIKAHIFGAYLQGGIGELAPTGNVRVVVEAQDYVRAAQVVAEWEAA